MLGVVVGGGIVLEGDRSHYAPIEQNCGVRNRNFVRSGTSNALSIRAVLIVLRLLLTTSADPFATMSAEQDESAKLWKVNRTIHELVKDRVRATGGYSDLDAVDAFLQGFQVSDDEINMDLATFRAHYANQAGSVE